MGSREEPRMYLCARLASGGCSSCAWGCCCCCEGREGGEERGWLSLAWGVGWCKGRGCCWLPLPTLLGADVSPSRIGSSWRESCRDSLNNKQQQQNN